MTDYAIYYCGRLLYPLAFKLNQTILVEKVYRTARLYSSTILLTFTKTPVAVVDITL